MNFDEWLWEVTKHLASKSIKFDEHDIFERIDLTDAKLNFIDGVTPENYKLETFKN